MSTYVETQLGVYSSRGDKITPLPIMDILTAATPRKE